MSSKGRSSEPGPLLPLNLKDPVPDRLVRSADNSPASSIRTSLLDDITSRQTRSQSFSLPNSSPTLVKDKKSKTPKPPARKKDECPCGKSSSGKEWLLPCSNCTQSWHNSCAGLKGNFTKPVLQSLLKTWHCPWCFKCAFPKPGKHKATKDSETLSEKVLSSAVFQEISDTVTEAIERTVKPPDLSELQKLVEAFTQQLNEFRLPVADRVPQEQLSAAPELVTSIRAESDPHECDPYSHSADFISEEQATDLISFLDQEEFKAEGSRKVAFYGERYHYKGSKNTTTRPIPNQLSVVINKIKEDFNLPYDLNQVLVNKYEQSAELPAHSDNEGSINPDSNIFTVSLGCTGKLRFTNIKSGSVQELEVEPNSLYSMSRQSQNFYKHQVLQNNTEQARYSITLRCVNWTFYNSTYAVGDSNFGRIEFGVGRGKVGAATPGMKDWAPCVSDIKPEKCASFKNVVIMCGTNDLKDSQCDVLKTYQVFKGKVEEMQEVNPHCNILVCPILPSRSREINKKINAYNRYLCSDLLHSELRVNLVQGFQEFADSQGFLKTDLHDLRTPNDKLHINTKGYCILVKLIKQAIFSLKRNKSSHVTGRLYSHVVNDR